MLAELAMVLPLFLSLLFGVISGGLAYSEKVGVVDAVREGARFGASLKLGSGPAALTTWETTVRNRVVAASGGGLTAASVCVRLVLPNGGTDCGVSDPSGASAESTVHLVKVSASKAATLEFIFFRTSATLQGKLAARYERDTG